MTTAPITITLAGQPYTVPQLTLGQIEDLSVAVVTPTHDDPQENVRRNFGRAIGIIRAALAKDYPELTAEAIRLLHITRLELNTATDAILTHSGLVTSGEA
jgi:hypothetical protein